MPLLQTLNAITLVRGSSGTGLVQTTTSTRQIVEQSLDLRSLVKTVFCLSKQRIPAVEDNNLAVQQYYWTQVKEKVPVFAKAMELAGAVKYNELAELFTNLW